MIGFTLRQNWHVIEPYMDWLQWLVIAAVVVVIAWWVARRMLLNRREGKHLSTASEASQRDPSDGSGMDRRRAQFPPLGRFVRF